MLYVSSNCFHYLSLICSWVCHLWVFIFGILCSYMNKFSLSRCCLSLRSHFELVNTSVRFNFTCVCVSEIFPRSMYWDFFPFVRYPSIYWSIFCSFWLLSSFTHCMSTLINISISFYFSIEYREQPNLHIN